MITLQKIRKPRFKLQLEVKEGGITDYQPLSQYGILVTPAIDEDYWLFRVPVSDKQAVVGFTKFGLLGIGFQHETDWNKNLPSDCSAEEIYRHISVNKGDDLIPKTRCIQAIRLIKRAWKEVQ